MTHTKFDWTRVNNDVNGNPRYVTHFLQLVPDSMEDDLSKRYEKTVKLMNKIGGRKYHNKGYGGGIVFTSYSLDETERHIERVKKEYDEKMRGTTLRGHWESKDEPGLGDCAGCGAMGVETDEDGFCEKCASKKRRRA